MITKQSLVPIRFILNTRHAMDLPPIRILLVDTDADEFTNAYDEAVRVACLKVKQAEQKQLEEQFGKKEARREWEFEIAA